METAIEIKKLEGIQKERDAQLARADAAIEKARETGHELPERQADWQRVMDGYSGLLAKQREAIAAAERNKAEAAAAEIAKGKARQTFIQSGGRAADFDAAWPGILASMTAQKLTAPNATRSNTRY